MALLPGFYNQGDQDIYQSGQFYIPQEQYRLGYTAPPSIANAPTGITNTQVAAPYVLPPTRNEGGGGSGSSGAYTGREYNPESYVTNRGYLSGDYIQGTEPEETKLQKFGRTVGQTLMNFVPGARFISSFDKFNTLSPVDQEFARQQMSFKEQSMHGGNLPNQDKYGYNKRSLVGNYADVIGKRVAIANARLAEGKELRDIDKYYLDKEEEQTTLTDQMKFNDFIRQRHAANKFREQEKLGIDNYPSGKDIHGGTDTSTGGATTVAPQHHGDVSRGPGGGGGEGHQAQNIRDIKDEGPGVTAGSGMHGGKHYAIGGRAGYKFGRGPVLDENVDENIFEIMQDQGVPHSDMVEGPSPFEMRINELMDEGMSWQEAYEIASEEFGQIAEGESDQGLASIV